jgi:autotransporter-associated beta strand protein
MKVRSPLLSLALGLIASAGVSAQSLWTGTLDASLNNFLNWTGLPPGGSDLLFGTTIRPLITVDSAIAVKSLTFSGLYPSYGFSSPNTSTLSIGSGGIVVALSGSNSVDFAAGLPLQLNSSQTWNVDGLLRVAGPVSGASATLTKSGTGTLQLNHAGSTFNGGVNVQQGSLLIGASSLTSAGTLISGPLGTGKLTLAANTSFGASKSSLTLGNDISLASGVTLLSGSNTGATSGLNLTGQVVAATSDVIVKLSGSGPLLFAGTVDGPASTVLRFQSVATDDLDSAAFTGTTTANIQGLIADHAALYFSTLTALPATVKVQAVNNGYVAVVSTTTGSPIPASALLNQIDDPAAFAGTFGFDTQPGSGAPHVYNENLDFSAFTHAAFNLGSSTEAVLTGIIKPSLTGTTAIYRFGGSNGHLFVQSNLTDASDPVSGASIPASVVVTTTGGSDPEGIIFSGANTFTGTTTVNGITSHLRVDKAIAILDSPSALPAGATFSLTDAAYVGYTEVAGFNTFADFLARLVPGGSSNSSIFGVDSHAFVQDKRTQGDLIKTGGTRVVTDVVDLSSLPDGFLGTLTRARISGEVVAPSSHVLQLTGIADGRLTITSNLTPLTIGGAMNINRVVIGYPTTSGPFDFGHGEVELTGASTYTGDTTLQSGALIIGNSSLVSSGSLVSGPIGTGTLQVTPSTQPVTLASNTRSGATLYNPITLSGSLQLGLSQASQDLTTAAGIDPNLLIIAGDISGSGVLDAYGQTILSGNNSYTGGTYAHRGGLIFATTSALPALPLVNALKSDADGYIGLASVPPSLQLGFIDRFDPAATKGTIGFDTLDGTTTVFSDSISLLGFSSPTLRLGSATSARLTGAITPPGTVYRFGGGGGSLEVASDLTGSRDVDVSSADGASMTLRLTGSNTYTGTTTVKNSAVIFGAGALPAGTSFVLDSTGYIGTEDTAFDSNFSGFLGHFATSLDRGIIGFDADPAAGSRTISTALDLSGFTAATPNFYLGTSSNLTFSSASSITLPVNATAYRFAAYKGGRLQIETILSGARGLVIGDPTSPMTQAGPTGTPSSVVLNAANTFANGTTFYAGNLYLGTSSVMSSGSMVSGPLGLGSLTVEATQFGSGASPSLLALSGPVTLANAIVLNSRLQVGSDLTLTGNISGAGALSKIDPGALVLSGNNSSWSGGLQLNTGSVTFSDDHSAGTGSLRMGSLASSITFLSSAPSIGSLFGDRSRNQVIVAPNSLLSISQDGSSSFLGGFSGSGAAVNITGFNPNVANQLTLGGANAHTGGTTIGSNVAVIAAHNDALGTSGTVTLNGGSLAVASGVVASFDLATHPLVVTSGKLGGTGTFAFNSSLDVRGDANGQVTLNPGFKQPGQLTLNFTSGATLILDSGGTYHWKLMDAQNPNGGWDSISVAGNVDVAATAVAPFNFTIESVSADGSNGEPANFDVHSSYSWTLLTATSITGFDSTKFSLDAAAFLIPNRTGTFSIDMNGAGTSLILNYTAAAIPEPSTWALLITGISALGVSAFRRRRLRQSRLVL